MGGLQRSFFLTREERSSTIMGTWSPDQEGIVRTVRQLTPNKLKGKYILLL